MIVTKRRPAKPRAPWGFVLPVLCALLLVACGGASGTPTVRPAGTTGSGSPVATGIPTSGQNTDKIDKIFLQLLGVYQTRGLDAAKQFARDQGLLTAQDEVRVTLVLDSGDQAVTDSTALAVQRIGGRVTTTVDDTMEIVVPVQAAIEYSKQASRTDFFSTLADFQHVRGVQQTPTATRMVTPTAGRGSSIQGGKSEGVALTGADKWQAAGITGKGVKVGVLDGAFNHYQDYLSNAKVTTRSFRADRLLEDDDKEDIHGTACAEIVNEMAPDAELYLGAFETTNEFVSAMRWLVGTVGVSAISISIGFPGQYPTDGSSPIAKEVDRAKAAGVFVAVSAGNHASGKIGTDSAEGHFGAVFHDGDGDGFNDFPGAKTPNALQVKIGSSPFRIALNWDDWQRPHVNYDLYLYDSRDQEVGRGDNDQSRGIPPVERVQGAVRAGTYSLKIKKVNPSDPDLPFHLYFSESQLEQVTPAGSILTPGDARGAFSVAAIDVKTSQVENFSSQGATMDGRMKPDIGAPDDVLSFAFASVGEKTFFGTSAAAPHVAGAVALYKQAVPDATPDAIFRFFKDHAHPAQGAQVGDNIAGAGLLFLDAPPQNVAANPTPRSIPGTATPAPTPIPAATRVVFMDTFASPSTGLPAAGYQNGEYRIRAGTGSLVPAIYPSTVNGGATETYEVQTRKVSGADDALFGLEIRRMNDDNYLLFVITNDGLYGIFARVNGSLRTVGSAGASSAIKPNAANTLRVTASGTTFAFSVNGQIVSQVDIADAGTKGAYGLIAGGGQKAEADVAFQQYRLAQG